MSPYSRLRPTSSRRTTSGATSQPMPVVGQRRRDLPEAERLVAAIGAHDGARVVVDAEEVDRLRDQLEVPGRTELERPEPRLEPGERSRPGRRRAGPASRNQRFLNASQRRAAVARPRSESLERVARLEVERDPDQPVRRRELAEARARRARATSSTWCATASASRQSRRPGAFVPYAWPRNAITHGSLCVIQRRTTPPSSLEHRARRTRRSARPSRARGQPPASCSACGRSQW